MTDFTKPHAVDDVTVAFPARVENLMPAYASIPDEFKHHRNPWCEFQAKWFYEGLKKEDFLTAKPGINYNAAMRHLSAIQGSFEPKHEHKMAAVAYLASLWFESPEPKTNLGTKVAALFKKGKS